MYHQTLGKSAVHVAIKKTLIHQIFNRYSGFSTYETICESFANAAVAASPSL